MSSIWRSKLLLLSQCLAQRKVGISKALKKGEAAAGSILIARLVKSHALAKYPMTAPYPHGSSLLSSWEYTVYAVSATASISLYKSAKIITVGASSMRAWPITLRRSSRSNSCRAEMSCKDSNKTWNSSKNFFIQKLCAQLLVSKISDPQISQ